MFGMSAAEIVILLVVGIVVVGPQKLPGLMRTAGQWIRRLRNLSSDLRAQSGIDRILREEGLDKELRELRQLRESLSKQAMLGSLVDAVNAPAGTARPAIGATTNSPARTSSEPAARPDASPASTRDAAVSSTTAASAARVEGRPTASAEVADAASRADSDTSSTDATTATKSSAAHLIRPAAGTVARTDPATTSPPVEPYASFREREYPLWGPDHYEAMTDDLDPSEEAISSSARGHGAQLSDGTDDSGMLLPPLDDFLEDVRT